MDKTQKIYSKTTYERFLETSDWYEIEVRLNGPGTVATQMVAVDGLLEGLKAIVFLENGWKKLGDADSDIYVSGLDKHFNKVRDHIAASDVLRKHLESVNLPNAGIAVLQRQKRPRAIYERRLRTNQRAVNRLCGAPD